MVKFHAVGDVVVGVVVNGKGCLKGERIEDLLKKYLVVELVTLSFAAM